MHLPCLLTKHSCALQVAFPYLYNNRPRKVRLSMYHHPMIMYIKTEDPDLPAFYFDPLIHPIPAYRASQGRVTSYELSEEEVQQEEQMLAEAAAANTELTDEVGFALPEGVDPFLADRPLYTETTAAGIALLWAPRPFNMRYVKNSTCRPCLCIWLVTLAGAATHAHCSLVLYEDEDGNSSQVHHRLSGSGAAPRC